MQVDRKVGLGRGGEQPEHDAQTGRIQRHLLQVAMEFEAQNGLGQKLHEAVGVVGGVWIAGAKGQQYSGQASAGLQHFVGRDKWVYGNDDGLRDAGFGHFRQQDGRFGFDHPARHLRVDQRPEASVSPQGSGSSQSFGHRIHGVLCPVAEQMARRRDWGQRPVVVSFGGGKAAAGRGDMAMEINYWKIKAHALMIPG